MSHRIDHEHLLLLCLTYRPTKISFIQIANQDPNYLGKFSRPLTFYPVNINNGLVLITLMWRKQVAFYYLFKAVKITPSKYNGPFLLQLNRLLTFFINNWRHSWRLTVTWILLSNTLMSNFIFHTLANIVEHSGLKTPPH